MSDTVAGPRLDDGSPTNSVVDLSAREQLTLIRSGELSARELLDAHLDRIEHSNPAVNAIVTLTPERAIRHATEADERAAAGLPLGVLHGLVVAHKDTHMTAGIRTTYGSPLRRNNVPDEDELIIERLRSAGTVTVGKSNVPEFGSGSHTFNSVFGATRNPYDLSKSAGGSSGGAAAALACGMVSLADGSDMGGSLRNPASFCNVVGLRPSPGRVASYPTSAPWGNLLVQGPMGRTVEDVALLLSVMAGEDSRDPISISGDGSEFAEPLSADVRGKRIAWSPNLGGLLPVEAAVTEVIGRKLSVFEDMGCVVEPACPDFAGADEVFRTLRASQMASLHGADLDAALPPYKRALADNVRQGLSLTGPDISRAERLQTALFHRMRLFFAEYDALILPVSQVLPFDVETEYPTTIDGIEQIDYIDWMKSSYFVSAGGSPALSVPGGFSASGLPVGVQIVGPYRAERALLQLGYAFEQANRGQTRRPTAVAR